MGDSFGGIIAELPDVVGDSRGLARFAGPSTAPPWRYESAGYIDADAQAPDGTIYATEWIKVSTFVYDKSVVVIDGQTGVVRSRHVAPREHAGCPTETSAQVGAPVVGDDGYAYVEVRGRTCGSQSAFTLNLWRIGPNGELSSEVLYHNVYGNAGCAPFPHLRRIAPDGLGGILAHWDHAYGAGLCGGSGQSIITRFDQDGVRSDYVVAEVDSTGNGLEAFELQIALTAKGTVYLQDPDLTEAPITAVDVVTWDTNWTATAGTPVMALDGGGILLHDATGITALDADGLVEQTAAVSIAEPQSILGGQRALHGADTTTVAPIEIVVPDFRIGERYFLSGVGQSGNPQAQAFQTVTCEQGRPPFSTVWKGVAPAEYTYRFQGGSWTTDQQLWVQEAFLRWSLANTDSGLGTTFRHADVGETQAITLIKQFLDVAANGDRIAGGTNPVPSPVPQNGVLSGANVYFNTDVNILSSNEAYLKVALHEIGHILGLGDNLNRQSGSSVMNVFGPNFAMPAIWRLRDDGGRYVATTVRPCDAVRAKDASTRSWP